MYHRIVFHRPVRVLFASALAATLALTAAACDDESSEDSAEADIQSCVEDDFQAAPLIGSGYNPEVGFTGDVQDSYIAHTTFLILNPDKTNRFNELMGPILADLETNEGLLAYSLGGSDKCGTVRTMGLWASQEAMYEFVLGSAHSAAMSEGNVVGINGATTSWEVLPDEIPMSWDLARTKISESGALY